MAHDHDGWRSLGFRGLPPMSGRVNQEVEGGFAPLIVARIEGQHAPFVGITTDGVVQTGLRSLDSAPPVPTAPIADAALTFVQALSSAQRVQACLPIDAPDWRTWTNVHVAFWRHGVLLDDLSPSQRDLALGILAATLSARGYEYATGIMELDDSSPRSRKTTSHTDSGFTSCRSSAHRVVTSRGAGRSTAITSSSAPSCSMVGSSRPRRSWAQSLGRSAPVRGSTSRKKPGCC